MSTPLGLKPPKAFPPPNAWQKLIHDSRAIPNTPHTLIPIESLHHLLPNLSLTQWSRKGITSIQHLFWNSCPKPFPVLQHEFNLPHTDLFTYIRVKHCIDELRLPLYMISVTVWEYLTSSSPKTKEISLFYNILHQKLQFMKSSPHMHWDNDLSKSFTEHQWERALRSIYR